MLKSIAKGVLRRHGLGSHKGPDVPSKHLLNVLELAVTSLFDQDAGVTCIQIGANDCAGYDPFVPLIRPGWKSILVEPQPWAADRLDATYADNANIHVERSVIAAASGVAKLYHVSGLDDGSSMLEGVASLSRDHVVRHVGDENRIATIEVLALTFADLKQKYGIEQLDILSIDAEGFDFEILKMIDFEADRPSVIFYEHRNLAFEDAESAIELLADAGYHLARVGMDTVAVRTDRLTNPKPADSR
ncbi:MAG: FkbM family methyltransferase [Planctomycetota bacterium]